MYYEVIIATKVKKNATIENAARKLNFPLTKLIIAIQHFSFKHPKNSLYSSTETPSFYSQIVTICSLGQVRKFGSVVFKVYLFMHPNVS
jgi:hypothetical protein